MNLVVRAICPCSLAVKTIDYQLLSVDQTLSMRFFQNLSGWHNGHLPSMEQKLKVMWRRLLLSFSRLICVAKGRSIRSSTRRSIRRSMSRSIRIQRGKPFSQRTIWNIWRDRTCEDNRWCDVHRKYHFPFMSCLPHMDTIHHRQYHFPFMRRLPHIDT